VNPFRWGTARQRVTLWDVAASTLDPYGQPSQVGVPIGTFWAWVLPLRGRRLTQARAVWPMASFVVTMRWLGSAIPITPHNPSRQILPRMYLTLSNGSRLDIIDANNVEHRNRQWDLTCMEIVVT